MWRMKIQEGWVHGRASDDKKLFLLFSILPSSKSHRTEPKYEFNLVLSKIHSSTKKIEVVDSLKPCWNIFFASEPEPVDFKALFSKSQFRPLNKRFLGLPRTPFFTNRCSLVFRWCVSYGRTLRDWISTFLVPPTRVSSFPRHQILSPSYLRKVPCVQIVYVLHILTFIFILTLPFAPPISNRGLWCPTKISFENMTLARFPFQSVIFKNIFWKYDPGPFSIPKRNFQKYLLKIWPWPVFHSKA